MLCLLDTTPSNQSLESHKMFFVPSMIVRAAISRASQQNKFSVAVDLLTKVPYCKANTTLVHYYVTRRSGDYKRQNRHPMVHQPNNSSDKLEQPKLSIWEYRGYCCTASYSMTQRKLGSGFYCFISDNQTLGFDNHFLGEMV